MDLDSLVARFPRIWHATFPGGWDGIARSGLRSSADLLDGAGRGDESRAVRPDDIAVTTADGTATLRAQKPNRKDPSPYLDALSVEEWWHLVNSRSYFFGNRDDLDKMVDGCLEQGVGQEVIGFETRRLLGPVADAVEVTTVNVGTFPRASGPVRGRSTFKPLADFTSPSTKIKDITVTVPITVVDNAVVSVVRMEPNAGPTRIFPPVRART